jgi:hypothetical protein
LIIDQPVSGGRAEPRYDVKIEGFASSPGRTRHGEFTMAADEMTRSESVEFVSRSLATLLPELADHAILYLCVDWHHLGDLLEAAGRHSLELKRLCVRCETNTSNDTFCRSQDELVVVFERGTNRYQKFREIFDRFESPLRNDGKLGQYGRLRNHLWTYMGVNGFGNPTQLVGVHPTVRPRKMIADALRDVSRQRNFVIDLFLGSGSTLIAAEEAGRSCIGSDVDPAHVEAAIRRWQTHTGRDAIHWLSRQTFDKYVEGKRAERIAAVVPVVGTGSEKNKLRLVAG